MDDPSDAPAKRCAWCSDLLDPPGRYKPGIARKYCSDVCRQRNYRQRLKEGTVVRAGNLRGVGEAQNYRAWVNEAIECLKKAQRRVKEERVTDEEKERRWDDLERINRRLRKHADPSTRSLAPWEG